MYLMLVGESDSESDRSLSVWAFHSFHYIFIIFLILVKTNCKITDQFTNLPAIFLVNYLLLSYWSVSEWLTICNKQLLICWPVWITCTRFWYVYQFLSYWAIYRLVITFSVIEQFLDYWPISALLTSVWFTD